MKPFIIEADGQDPFDAFLSAGHQDMAAYPPTGIAHKSAFRMIHLDDGEKPNTVAQRLLEDPASPIYGIAAPAGCLPAGQGKFLFFGWRRI